MKAYSHQSESGSKSEKDQELSKRVKEQATKIKENFCFLFHFLFDVNEH